MKKVWWGSVILVMATCVGWGHEGPGLTHVIYRPTAYTLPAGTWQIRGTLDLTAIGLPGIGVAYGLAEGLQIGTGLTGILRGWPNLGIKLALGQVGPIALAASAGLSYAIAEGTLYLSSGVVSSFRAGHLGIHAGASLGLLPEFYLSPYAAFDYLVAENLALLGELGLLFLDVRAGVLFRPLESLDLRAWIGFPGPSLGAGVALRFLGSGLYF